VSRSKVFDPCWVNFFVAQVGSGQPSLVWVWEISPKNPNFFNFLPFKNNLIGLGQKVPGSELCWPLIYCVSKVCSGWVRAHLKLRLDRISLYFNAINVSFKISYDQLNWPFTLINVPPVDRQLYGILPLEIPTTTPFGTTKHSFPFQISKYLFDQPYTLLLDPQLTRYTPASL